jgi:RimJ/RimL family protein N-acetyltransferase
MIITFIPLTDSHFPLLLKWLEAPHVKAWWDRDVVWTPELIKEKYAPYVNGYKCEAGIEKPIKAYIIHVDQEPIGYIQLYNAYDFLRSQPLQGLPQNLAAFDLLIGEVQYLRKGIGSFVLKEFFDHHCDPSFTHILADPDRNNIAAIRAYEKAGFKKIKEWPDEFWMIKEQNIK